MASSDWLLELLGMEVEPQPKSPKFSPGNLVQVGVHERMGLVTAYYWNHELKGWHYQVLLCGKLAIFPSELLNSCNVRKKMV